MTTPTRIFVSRSPGETRAALLAAGRVLQVAHIRDAEAQAGAIYAARVGEHVPGSADVFVDIGCPPHGVLEAKGEKLTTGQFVAVEVLTPARADKGHKLKHSATQLPPDLTSPILLQSGLDAVLMWWKSYSASLTEIVAQPQPEMRRMADLLGRDAPIVAEAHDDFTFADIDEQLEEALERVVVLPSGGRVIIEPTSALIAIDIDSGGSSVEVANGEAMRVIARHMRLRNLAGHILIDLIPSRDKIQFVKMLKTACAADPVETRIMGLTPSGMIDVVRRRAGPSLAETLLSLDAVAYRALRLACRDMLARKVVRVALHVAPVVAALLNEVLHAALKEAVATAKGEIIIVSRNDFTPQRIDVSDP